MRSSIFGFWPPASSACVTIFLLATILLSVVSEAAPSSTFGYIRRRDNAKLEGHHHAHDHASEFEDMGMASATAAQENDDVPTLSAIIAIPSEAPAAHHDANGGHSHGSHQPPKTILNDTDIHLWHKYPPSYLAADFRLDKDSAIFGEEFDESWDPNHASSHRALLLLHAGVFYTAYFGLLPISLALRAAEHPVHHVVGATFLALATLGWLFGLAYNTSTPDRYEGSVYPFLANLLILTSYVLAAIDLVGFLSHRGPSADKSWRSLIHLDRWINEQNRYEMLRLEESGSRQPSHEQQEGRAVFALGHDDEEEIDGQTRSLASAGHRRPSLMRHWSPLSRNSSTSEGTLHDSPIAEHPTEAAYRKPSNRSGAYDVQHEADCATLSTPAHQEGEPIQHMGASRFLQIVLTWIRRFQVVFAYVLFIIGMATYTGMCRGSYVNSCAAHYIKGSIFFGYGLLTFARYLGAYADLGWAWNRHSGSRRGPSAEMVECSVIFFYGITNTWLERLGAAPGSPYNVKQVQHISIAIMFWFAGLSGILLESKTVRRILAAARDRRNDTNEPLSYAFSFNPLPALVIAVTGLAMAAHHQTYVFQVEIHSLWGILLAGGSAFRFLTYFFLWLRPPTDSLLPSRPPTEVLTSFGYAAGGIVFMLSNEEIAFAAMRAGYDDMMAFLNFTIALTSLIFCWTVVVMACKGWGVMRMQREEVNEEGS